MVLLSFVIIQRSSGLGRGAVGKVGKKVLIKVHKYKPSRIPELVVIVLIALKTL